MTDQLTDGRFERELTRFLAWEAGDIGDAPSAADMAARVSARTGSRGLAESLRPQLVWILLAALLLALLGAAVAGAMLMRLRVLPAIQVADEAVFLRAAKDSPNSHDVLVIGVDHEGHEREIARLPEHAFIPPSGPAYVPKAAVSRDGLLVAQHLGNGVMWQIIDLRNPQSTPRDVPEIIQEFESREPTIIWGPGDRLAVTRYIRGNSGNDYRVVFVDGRTGAATDVDLPDDYFVLPYWLADGSGVLLGTADALLPDGQYVLRLDGAVAEQGNRVVDAGYGRILRQDGSGLRVDGAGVWRVKPSGGFDQLLPPSNDRLEDVTWTSGGDGLWLIVRKPGTAHELVVERVVLPSANSSYVASVVDDADGAAGSTLNAQVVGASSDDSMIYVVRERLLPTGESRALTPFLIDSESGRSFETSGQFAGWLDVSP